MSPVEPHGALFLCDAQRAPSFEKELRTAPGKCYPTIDASNAPCKLKPMLFSVMAVDAEGPPT